MTQTETKGSCLCGKVTLHIPALADEVGICHCGMCRKWVGGPFLAIECGQDFRISGEEHLGVYNSSDWAERVFCKNCGSALFYRLKQGGMVALSAGLFDKTEAFHLEQQIFIDEKPSYYEFANDTPKLTGAEVFAAFDAEQEK